MYNIINKELVKKRFQRSLKNYNNEATVQKDMSSQLITFLTEKIGVNFENILEIGCGTGNMTQLINDNLDFKNLFANDIVEYSENYIKSISYEINFISGDAETVKFPENLDLIISNASFQWISDVYYFFNKLHSCLKSDGVLAFTSFSPNNFNEIAKVTNNKLQYFSTEEFLELINDLFYPIYTYNQTIKLNFNDPLQVLEHIKHMGVNAIDQRVWTKKDLNEFKINYIKHFSNDGKVNLTYCPSYYILKAR